MAEWLNVGIQVFLDYLSRLGYEDYQKSKPPVCFSTPPLLESRIGADDFIKRLDEQNTEQRTRTEEAKLAQMRLLQTELLEKYKMKPEIYGFLKFIKDFMKEFDKTEKVKSDRNSSASTWKTDKFQKYFSLLKVGFVPPFQPEHNLSDNAFSSIQKRFLELAPVFLGIKVQDVDLGQEVDFLQDLVKTEHPEAVSRVFMDALISPILRQNGCQLRLEEKLYVKDTLPNCIADYVIYDSDGDIFGVIETKAGGKIKAESIIQCMLQLLALRTKAAHKLFGVVTDAFRYIFIVLTPDGTFQFEDDSGQGQGEGQGHYDVTTWKELNHIASIFHHHVREHEMADLAQRMDSI